MAKTNDDKGGVTPFFKVMAIHNPKKTKEAGREIFDDMEVVEVRFAGSNNFSVFPATAQSHWEEDETGEQHIVTYAERWPRQYKQFKQREVQTKSGTPLDYCPFLTASKRAELRALNVYTVEALAALDGQELKNLGQGGRELKNQAQEYIATASTEAIVGQLREEVQALKAQLEVRQDDEAIKSGKRPVAELEDDDALPPERKVEEEEEEEEEASGDFDQMSSAELKAFIAAQTGHKPVGNPSHKTLVAMAEASKS